MSFATRSADALEFFCFALIFIPYGHYDETKTLSNLQPQLCDPSADGEHGFTSCAKIACLSDKA